jgi:rhamnogalacturonyl hydrolase YesR
MKRLFLFLCLPFFALGFSSCKEKEAAAVNLVEENVNFAAKQYGLMTEMIEDSGKILNPKSFINGKFKFIPPTEWTSGFFPGSLWYLYELSSDEKWKMHAERHTEALDTVQYLTNTHDVGFMINCSYCNGLRLTGNKAYEKVIVQAAKSLITRYKPGAGIIQSWNANPKKDWKCPVIIDNMMNLELLFNATKLSGDSTFYNIAVSHADQTMKNHYRPDFSTWHVVDYDPENGNIRHKNTHQGYSDESSWARGQSWGIYGFVMCYRETKDPKYLHQAEKALEFVAGHPIIPTMVFPIGTMTRPIFRIPAAMHQQRQFWHRHYMKYRPIRQKKITKRGRTIL